MDFHSITEISVAEHPIVVNDSIDKSWKTVPEFDIVVKTNERTLHIVRYIPDFYSFDHLVKSHYQKIKIPFPTLIESISKAEKRRSIRNFFHISTKSNAEKIEKYLYRCSMDPVLKSSTLLRDFFSLQREGDSIRECVSSHASASSSSSSSSDYRVPTSYAPQLNMTDDIHPSSISDITDSHPQEAKVWVPSPQHSIISLPDSFYDQPESEEDINDNDSIESVHILSTDMNEQYDNFDYNSPLDHFEMMKVLGKGCMGKVMLVRSRTTKQLYALKSIVKGHVIDQREITHTLDERGILARLSEINHPYLAKLHASFQDEYRLYLLTNYYCGGDLATQMAKLYNFPSDCALFYAAEIIDGIGELHRLGVLYRDLKPENILLTGDGHVVLTDFGLSKWLDQSNDYSTQTFCGTAEYLAPEVLLGNSYSFGIDHWSFGTILYEMLAGITPFWADNHSDMYRRVLEDPLEFPATIFDYETAEFLTDLLERDPEYRLGANGIDEIKNHVYFSDISWDDIRHRRVQPPYLSPVTDELDFVNFDPDFLAMSPNLTPVPSEVDFGDEIQDVFDGYSFADEEFMELEHEVSYHHNKEFALQHDGFCSDAGSEIYKGRNRDDQQHPPLFQPARKRGSISMLSHVDSFCLDTDVLEKPSFAKSPLSSVDAFMDEEHARYAKRRNTSASEDHSSALEEQQEQQHAKAPSTLVVMSYHIAPEPQANNKATVSESTSVSTFEDLEFSQLPDLRLSFNMDREQEKSRNDKIPASTKSSKTNTSSRTRRFFSLLL